LVAAVTVALAGLGGGTVNAATPAWNLVATATPAKVTAGTDAYFSVTVHNTGKSNISQVFLTDALDNTAGTVSAVPYQILNTTYVSPSQGTCDPIGAPLHCSLGALRAGKSVTITVAYSTAGLDQITRIFEGNTTGVAGDNQGASHGDVVQDDATTGTGSGPDFAGRFIKDDVLTVADEAISDHNPQSTKVTAPKGGIGVSVEDGTNGPECPGGPTTCFSQASEIHVDGGNTYKNGFKVEISVYKDLSQTVRGVYHQTDGGTWDPVITTKCSKSTPPAVIPCYSVNNLAGGNVLVTVWLTQNGVIRF
jgi:uncharacterized repeat protein (TIGR01451 family)